MTKEERQNIILDYLFKSGSVQVCDLATTLAVSSVTIRKDLTELEKAGKLYRSHGKAILINPFTNNRSVNEKEKYYAEEKNLIGMEASKLIMPNDSIVLASGTTIHALARCIHPVGKLTVVSASLQATETLAMIDDVEIIQLGCSFSKLYLGVDGIDFDFGISTTDLREAELNRQMMLTAQKIIVLADSSKFGRRGFAKIANLEDIDVIITDSQVSPAVVRRIEELGIELIIAEGRDLLAVSANRQ